LDLKWTERGVEEEFFQRIVSWFALLSVQSVSFKFAISISHGFGLVCGTATAPEPVGFRNKEQNKNINPKHVIGSKAA
jgi:hypothetical protein